MVAEAIGEEEPGLSQSIAPGAGYGTSGSAPAAASERNRSPEAEAAGLAAPQPGPKHRLPAGAGAATTSCDAVSARSRSGRVRGRAIPRYHGVTIRHPPRPGPPVARARGARPPEGPGGIPPLADGPSGPIRWRCRRGLPPWAHDQ